MATTTTKKQAGAKKQTKAMSKSTATAKNAKVNSPVAARPMERTRAPRP